MRLGYVAFAAGADGDARPAVAGQRDHDPIVGNDGRGIDQRPHSVARPKLRAGLRVEPLHLVRHAEDQLFVAVDLGDDRGAPGTKPFGVSLLTRLAARLLVFPGLLAGLFVQRDEELSLAGAAPEDDMLAMQDWRGGVAPN